MYIETITAIAPSYWAPFLINGDGTGLEPDERDQAEAFADWLVGGHWQAGAQIVDCEDAGFRWRHDATQFGVGGADCQEYTALIER